MAHLLELHDRGVTPPNMQQYVLERVSSEKNSIIIRASLVPWGPYKVYYLAQVIGGDGKIFMRISLESGMAINLASHKSIHRTRQPECAGFHSTHTRKPD